MKGAYISNKLVLLLTITLLSGMALASSHVSADDTSVVDQINITVPVSCTMSGTGMQSHNATINNGQYDSTIGETTMKAFCNDSEGFAIYAIGYTDNTDGKNVLTNADLGAAYDIVTGTLTSGADSQWAMKLSTDTTPEPTYPIVIQNNFDSFREVPDVYTLVAKRAANTDLGTNAEGSTLKSTYQTYISTTQSAGTYTGQVKYVLVHPNYVGESAVRDAVTVVFDGNGLIFPDGSTTNTVKYTNVCKPARYTYVGDVYQEIMTSNLSAGGIQNGTPYTDNERISQTITVPNADKVKVVVDYGITAETAGVAIIEGTWDGGPPSENYAEIASESNMQGQQSFTFEGDTITIYSQTWGVPESGYDYGFYVRIYPVYNTEQPNTVGEELPSTDCSFVSVSGSYVETTEWHDRWKTTVDGQEKDIMLSIDYGEMIDYYPTMEEAVKDYLLKNYNKIGSEVILRAYNPVTFDEVYAEAGKTKNNDYYVIQDLDVKMCNNVSPEEETTVVDIRDNNTYKIVKLYDGNCWFKEDLRLDPTDSTVAASMSELNTNASNEEIYNYIHGGNSGNVDGWTSVGVSKPNDWPYNSGATMPFISFPENENIGVYYNYCAATVGTYCYDGATNVSSSTMPSDICPAGWRLFTADEAMELNHFRYYSYRSVSRAASIFLRTERDSGGYYSPGGVNNETDSMTEKNYTHYWSALPYGIKYDSYHGVEQPFRGNYYDLAYGKNIRCVISTSD